MFKKYMSKPIVRLAHCITSDDALTFNTIENKYTITTPEKVTFVAHEKVNVGDYVVHLNDDDIYHCNAKVFAERNVIDNDGKVTH